MHRSLRSHGRTGWVVLALVLLTTSCRSVTDADVTFVISTAEALPRDARVYIAGSDSALGSWHPSGLSLTRSDSLTWAGIASFPVGTEVEYKITRGSWQNEALDDFGNVPPNQRLMAERDTVIEHLVRKWKQEPPMRVTGTLITHESIGAPGLEARDVTVWLPPGYDADPSRRYPVLYAHDGQNLFDPQRAAFGVDWQLDENADSLMRSGRIRPALIVGIDNTAKRSQEYHDTELGGRYQAFIVDTVKPMIDREYRTLADAKNTAAIGSSSGGFAAFLLLWNYPDVFSAAACLSPYFPETIATMVEEAPGSTRADQKLYVDIGGDELDTRLLGGVDRMLPLLRRHGFEDGRNLMYERFPDDGHNESAWAARVWRPLIFFFRN